MHLTCDEENTKNIKIQKETFIVGNPCLKEAIIQLIANKTNLPSWPNPPNPPQAPLMSHPPIQNPDVKMHSPSWISLANHLKTI